MSDPGAGGAGATAGAVGLQEEILVHRLIGLFVLLLFLPLLSVSTQAPAAGCTNAADYATLPAALAVAQAAPARCLHIPAGTYTLSGTGGALLDVMANDVEIGGDGAGKTVLKTTDTITLTGHLWLIRTTVARTFIHDLSLAGGTNMTAPAGSAFPFIAVYAGAGATAPHLAHLDISNVYGEGAAGGSGVNFYQPPTANGGRQDGLVEDVTVHDSARASGMIINSSGNTLRHNTIRDVGSTSLQHGLYMQGGYNIVEGNTIERVSGWSIHGYKNTIGIDSSGDRYVGNLSLSPGAGHIVVAGSARYATIVNNVLRGGNAEGISVSVSALISNNQIEDVGKSGGSLISVENDTIVSGNSLEYTTALTATYGIRIGGTRSRVTDNRINLGSVSGIIARGPDNQIAGNIVQCGLASWARCLQIAAPNNEVAGNLVIASNGAIPFKTFDTATGLRFHDNVLRNTTGGWVAYDTAAIGLGQVYENRFDGAWRITSTDTQYWNNTGMITP